MVNSLVNKSEIMIGIIGPESLRELTREVLTSFPNFKSVYSHELNPIQAARALIDQVDVLLFLEWHLYQEAKSNMDIPIPVHHVPLMGTGLYRSLILICSRFASKSLSIDTIDVKYAEQILHELDEKDYSCFPYAPQGHSSLIDSTVSFHIGNYRKHGTIALTGIQQVAEKLKELDIPNEWVTPTKQDMIVSLERALLAAETRRNKEAQIVFGVINIDNFGGVTQKYRTEHDIQFLKLKVQQMLLDYTKQLDGHLINAGGDEFLFITTRGIFERETRGYKFIPLIKETKSELGITLSIGVGFGSTAAEAGNHARIALRQSKELHGNVCYIVREDQSVLGPVEITTNTQYEKYDLAITDAKLLDKAEKAGMSAAYMTKLMARVARYKKYDYTAQELASTLKITNRSAHRILLKWMDADIVDIIGEERLSHKGRPRRIYRLSFMMEADKQ